MTVENRKYVSTINIPENKEPIIIEKYIYKDCDFDSQFAEKSDIIKLKKMSEGVYEISVTLNSVLKINLIFDSGATDISISPDVASTLIKTGTVKETDFIGNQTYQFADGTKATSPVFIIRKIQIGSHELTDVRASISNSIDAPMLLGQSVLERFGKITIDNVNQTLTFQK